MHYVTYYEYKTQTLGKYEKYRLKEKETYIWRRMRE